MNMLQGRITKLIIVVVGTIVGIVIIGILLLCIIKLFCLEGSTWQNICSYIDWIWLEKYQAFFVGSVVTSLLFVAALIALYQLDAARKISYADLLIRLSNEWNSEPYMESRRRIFEIAPLHMDLEQQRQNLKERISQSQQGDAKDYFILTMPIDFFECLALLTRRGYIPLKDVKRTYGGAMVSYFKSFKYWITDMRSTPGNEDAYVELEAVINDLKK